MKRGLRRVDERGVDAGLLQPVRRLLDLKRRCHRHRLSGWLASQRPDVAAAIDRWSLPDAVWQAICEDSPELRLYPLGEHAARGTKRTLAHLMRADGDGATPADGAEDGRGASRSTASRRGDPAAETLRQALRAIDERHLARLLLTEVLFEIAMDQLTRSNRLVFRNYFDAAGVAISVALENRRRGGLRRQCAEIAESLVAQLRRATAAQLVLETDRIGAACLRLFGELPARDRKRPPDDQVNVVSGPMAERVADVAAAFDVPMRRLRGGKREPRLTRLLTEQDAAGRSKSKDRARYNVHFTYAPFESPSEPLCSGPRDLLDLGVAVHMSDLFTHRTRELVRRTGLLISARHDREWSAARDLVTRAVAHLGREKLVPHFQHRRDKRQKLPIRTEYDGRCVCLFSGGLDSLAGAAWALDQGLQPILVSHFHWSRLHSLQQELIGDLGRVYGRKLQHISFPAAARAGTGASIHKLGSPRQTVMRQHLRSFLYLCAAAAVALQNGIRHVYMFENGPLAVNPAISEARVNTRTAHPHVLASVARMIREVFGADIEIVNPFLYLTKGEVARVLHREQLVDLLGRSASCWESSRIGLKAHEYGLPATDATHDGDCLPCIVRRAAVQAAGMSAWDAEYLVDVFGDTRNLRTPVLLRLTDLLRFCATVTSLPDDELLARVPELSVWQTGIDGARLTNMLRRHAQQIRRAFRERSSSSFRRDFARLL